MQETTPQDLLNQTKNKEEYKYKVSVQKENYFYLKDQIEALLEEGDYILEMLTFRVHKSDPYGEIGFCCYLKNEEDFHLVKLLVFGPVA